MEKAQELPAFQEVEHLQLLLIIPLVAHLLFEFEFSVCQVTQSQGTTVWGTDGPHSGFIRLQCMYIYGIGRTQGDTVMPMRD